MRGNRYNTVEDNFDGAVPPNNTGGAQSSMALAKEKAKEDRQKQEETRSSEKERAKDFIAKRKELASAKTEEKTPLEKAKEIALERVKSNKGSEPEVDGIQAEEEPKKKIVWNPNSKYAGMGRVIQHVKPLKKVSDGIINMGNRYSEEVEYEEDSYGLLSMASKVGSKISSTATKVGSTLAKTGSNIATKTGNAFKKSPLMTRPGLVPPKPLTGTMVGPQPNLPSGKPLMTRPNLVPKPTVTSTNPHLGNTVGNPTSIAGPQNNPSLVNQAGRNSIATSINKKAGNVGSTIKGVLNSKLKSAAVGAGVGATVAAAQGKNPVKGAFGGAVVGTGVSYVANKAFSFLDEMPGIVNSDKALLRDKIISSGYSKELSIIDKTESGERKIDKTYLEAKKIISNFLSNKRASSINLKDNRGIILKKLGNPKDEKMYSSLNLLYLHCENSQK